jgi:S-adenosylmethionine-diacylglycerol 3-amino-3-carboxypropyl transferase
MKAIYDFGLSQEDFRTEKAVLDLQPGDRLLCVASGGELPLNLLCTHKDVAITAVDISPGQIYLCKLKMLAALHINYPLNGYFLGYGKMQKAQRRALFEKMLSPQLTEEEERFWRRHLAAIEAGVVNAGRFEKYLRKLQWVAKPIIGIKNIRRLMACATTTEQQAVFDQRIVNRNGVRFLFKLAFHPAIYRNRGLQAKALQHASEDTGTKYLRNFRDFCTATPAKSNYFLQYFLLGACQTPDAFPEYLYEANRKVLMERTHVLCFKQCSFAAAIESNGRGAFNKIHFSNIGDWLSVDEFKMLWGIMREALPGGAKLCYRFLQKNHFHAIAEKGLLLCNDKSLQEKDRFPFYSTIAIHWHASL